MATTTYGVNDAYAVKLWAKELEAEALKKTYVNKFIGTSADSLIHQKTETKKSAGDRITFGLRMLSSGDGVLGDGILEGNEESLTTYSDALVIDQLRHGHKSGGRMSQQRVPYEIRKECKESLADWWADRMDFAFANQLAGNTGQTNLEYTGQNATVAPTDYVYGGDATSEGTLDSSDVFTLNLLDKALEKARARTDGPPLRPLRVDGEEKFVAFLHDYQVTSLRTASGATNWLEIQKSALSGNGSKNNPIFSGALGEYNGIVLHRWNRLPAAPSNASVRRAVLCGAQAVSLAFGRDSGPNRFTWVEKMFDYENQLGVSAGCILGMKKTQFNSKDYGVITIPTWAVAS